MVYVGSSWVELDYWTSPTWGDYDARMRVLARSTQDIASNTSKVYFKLQKRVTGGSAYNYDDRDFTISMSGHSASQTWNFGSVSDTSWVDVGGDTDDMYWSNVSHNSDGSLTLTANATGDRPMSGSFDTDISIELPTIPRASSPSISPNPQTWSNTSTNRITVNTNRKSSGFTHTIRCDVWGFQQTKTGVGASTTFDIPYSALASMPASQTEFSGSIHTQTYSGNTAIGSEVRTYWTIKLDTSLEHPNIETVTLSEGNSRVAAIVNTPNTFVQGISTLVVNAPLTVTGSYTQLVKATVSNGGDNRTYTLSGTSGTVSYTSVNNRTTWLTVTVYDKRGTTAVSKPSWTLLPYAPLTATATVGRTSATGDVAVGQVSGVAYGGEYGQSTNSLTISYRYKEHNSSTWIDGAETFTKSLNSGQQTYTQAMTFSESFDYQKQYDIQFTVSDLFSTATYTAQLMQGLPILSWDETEVDVWGSLHIHDRDNPTVYQDVLDGFDAYADDQKNVLPCMPASNSVASQGITFTRTIQSVGTAYINVNGTATGRAFYNVNESFELVNGRKYILSGLHDEWQEGFSVWLRYSASETNIVTAYDEDVEFTAPSEPLTVYLFVNTGTVVSNKKWYPMIRDARIASPTYVPYRPLSKRWPMGTSVYTSGSKSIAAGASGHVDISITNPLNGRKPFAILRTWSNGNIVISYCSTASNINLSSVTVWYRNTTSGTVSCTFSVEILYIDANFVV